MCTKLARLYVVLAVVALVVSAVSAAEPSPAAVADFLVKQLPTPGGLALQIGCGQPGLAIELAKRTGLKFQCVDPDAKLVQAAREAIDAAELYGRVCADQEPITPLNYPDSCANLVLSGAAAGLLAEDIKECCRVLSPNGVALLGQAEGLTREALEAKLRQAGIEKYELLGQAGVWARIVKPRPAGGDEWLCRAHDPANTFASLDQLAAGPFRPQWICPARPGLDSAALAVADGKLIIASMSYDKFPRTTPYLQALDAYSGAELWSRVGKQALPIDRPPGMYSNREQCCDYAVAEGLLYLLASKFCHVFSVNDGTTVGSIPIPPQASPAGEDAWLYLAVSGDSLIGAVGPSPKVSVSWETMFYRGMSKSLFVLDRKSQALRWVHQGRAKANSFCVGDGKVFFADEALTLHALDLAKGTQLWAAPLPLPAGSEVSSCALYGGKLFVMYNLPVKAKQTDTLPASGAMLLGGVGMSDRKAMAFSAGDGKKLFDCDFGVPVGSMTFSRGMVFGGCLHAAGLACVDADTGANRWSSPLFGQKCSPILASANCMFYNPGTTALVSLDVLGRFPAPASQPATPTSQAAAVVKNAMGRSAFNFSGFRPSCSFPAVPGYGMLFVQGGGCGCASPIRGNVGLTPGKVGPIDDADRLIVLSAAPDKPEAPKDVWASWRGDAARSGRTAQQVPATPTQSWSRKLSGKLAPLAARGELVIVGSSNRKLIALDVRTGKPRWQYIAGGAITVAPWVDGPCVYFADQAGYAHCLLADTGAELWRFRAALGRERMILDGDFASRWPAGSGVVVREGVAYLAAGLFPDHRVAVYALDARTGQLRWQQVIQPSPYFGRTGGFVPNGAIAVGADRLFFSCGVGSPWSVGLEDGHKVATVPGYHVRGHDLMALDNSLLAVAPELEFIYHVGYAAPDPAMRLPVVDDQTVYLLNQQQSWARHLLAARRDAFNIATNRQAMFSLKPEMRTVKPDQYVRWKAWKDQPMTVMIQAGGTLLSGGAGKIYATAAADGQELWAAPAPGSVTDLAVNAGRLLAVTDDGSITCWSGN